jgi:glyoxylase-like metal-dependent hydrolase (beta-lactamase superfamily II)
MNLRAPKVKVCCSTRTSRQLQERLSAYLQKKYLESKAVVVHTKQIGQNLFLIDLETAGFRNLIGSYVLKSEKIVIVETGPSSSIPNLLLGLKELEVKPEDVAYVALTHVHADHAGGAGTLLQKLPNAKVVVHPKGAPHLADPARLWQATKDTLGEVADMFGQPQPIPKERIISASNGMTIDTGNGAKLEVLETPGHASHSLAYYDSLNEGIFTGDAAGAYLPEFNVVFPTTPPPFRPDIALISLDKMARLNPRVLYYSHFGMAPDGAKRLRAYSTQIRMWLNLALDGVKRGDSLEGIRETILREDETVKPAVPSLRANPVHMKTLIENSLLGFVEFAKNPQI